MPNLNRSFDKKPLGVGESSYKSISSRSYYVDKTLMIKDVLDSNVKVSLFTRPRRFGKTLNMDMLRVFFEKDDDNDTSIYFKDKKIWREGERYQKFQGKFPVIFLSFVGIESATFEEIKSDISNLVSNEFIRHQEVLSSSSISKFEKEKFISIIRGNETEGELKTSISFLSSVLNKVYKSQTIIIIDEYDTPIQSGFYNDYYDEIIRFMRSFLSTALKANNQNYLYCFLTGIIRISKESIFSDLNNVVVYDVLNNYFSSYFGFTEEEVEEMYKYYGFGEKIKEVQVWFDGYVFGQTKIYNPWSVSYYLHDCLGGMLDPKPYWADTASNETLGKLILSNADSRILVLKNLMSGVSVDSSINSNITYPMIDKEDSNLFSFLLMTGYLTAEKDNDPLSIYKLRIPNKEIKSVFTSQILSRVMHLDNESVTRLGIALEKGDVEKIRKIIGQILRNSASYYDFTREESYQTFLLGLLALCNPKYKLLSNRESGIGRLDFILEPRNEKLPAIVIELKHSKNEKEELKELSKKAIKQINDKKYGSECSSKGIIKYGMAFRGKEMFIKEEYDPADKEEELSL